MANSMLYKPKKFSHVLAGVAAAVLLASQLPVCAATVPALVGEDLSSMQESGQILTKRTFSANQMEGTGDARYDEADGVWRIDGDAALKLNAAVETAGAYQVALEYQLDEDGSKPLELSLSLNGQTPVQHSLARVYFDKVDGAFGRDAQGNDIKPQQATVAEFVTAALRQGDYLAGENYAPLLTAGDNTLTLTMKEQTAVIRSLTLYQTAAPAAYAKPSGYSDNSSNILIEAEYPLYKSSSMLYPISDRTSTATTPYHYSQIRLNTLGGSNWKEPGQWVTWEIPVSQAGYYKISMRVRQNITRGMKSLRRIYIDGAIPCRELDGFAFSYDRAWQVVTLGNEKEEFYFFLDKGTHTLTMEAAMGENVAVYEQLNGVITELNSLYRKIIKITGVSPDIYRTYNLGTAIPGLTDDLRRLSGKLRSIVSEYEAYAGSVGTELSFLLEMASLMENYIKDPAKIASTLSTFESNISTMSTLLTTLTQQPLLVDKIQVSGKNAPAMTAKAGFFQTLWNGIRSFFASFVTDYNAIGGAAQGNRTLKVWMTSGQASGAQTTTSSSRDQANILKAMLDDTFTPRTGIRVQLSLITSGLVEATMAGRGPDVALGVARSVPIDMGARGVLADLTQYKDFDAVRSRFQSSALNAYTYKGKVFGLPETQDFYMMYVRTDILGQLGLESPETWDDLMSVITTLSQENMQVGMPQAIIGTLLAQNGMTYYQEDLTRTVFSTQKAYEVYADFIKVYRDYKQPYYYNAGNRFKTGVMPIVFDLLSFYNTMSVLAPEIKGQWEIYELPGTRLEDGGIAGGGDASGVAAILFKSCADIDAGYALLDWWTGEDTQYRYGMELENLLGSAGRYSTANVAAFSRLNWAPSQTARINAQRKMLREIPEIPGSYIISRNLTNLFLDVMENGAILRESMLRYAGIMDDELARKKIEMEELEGS